MKIFKFISSFFSALFDNERAEFISKPVAEEITVMLEKNNGSGVLPNVTIDKEPKNTEKNTTMENIDAYNLTVDQLIASLKKNNHVVFENDTKDYNLNYVGVRTNSRIPNAFDDVFYMFWKYNGKWVLVKHTGTTDPGTYWLENPTNVDGTAILKPGQHRGTWKQGLHQGKYPALVQKKEVTVLRDDDGDNELDFDTTKERTGYFGINHHRTGSKKSTQVDKWSAGCQVRNDPEQYTEFWNIIIEAGKIWGDSYTYTLIEEKTL